jgi:hypothetical protein
MIIKESYLFWLGCWYGVCLNNVTILLSITKNPKVKKKKKEKKEREPNLNTVHKLQDLLELRTADLAAHNYAVLYCITIGTIIMMKPFRPARIVIYVDLASKHREFEFKS